MTLDRFTHVCSGCASSFTTSDRNVVPPGWVVADGRPFCDSCMQAAIAYRREIGWPGSERTDHALQVAAEVTREELIDALKLAHESISADPKRPILARYLHMIVRHAEGRAA